MPKKWYKKTQQNDRKKIESKRIKEKLKKNLNLNLKKPKNLNEGSKLLLQQRAHGHGNKPLYYHSWFARAGLQERRDFWDGLV